MSEEIKEEIKEEVQEEVKEEIKEEPKAEEPEAEEVTVEAEMPEEQEEPIGNIKISVDVVTTIAGIAAAEIEGVSNMYSSFVDEFAQRLGAKKSGSQGVRVEMNGDTAGIDLYIVVDYGVKIPELAWSIQENVKKKIERMTGLGVSYVNIHIEGISFEKAAEAAVAQTAE